MSLGGEIMEEHYDKLVQSFLKKLDLVYMVRDDPYEKALVRDIIEAYKEHFRNSGIYDS